MEIALNRSGTQAIRYSPEYDSTLLYAPLLIVGDHQLTFRATYSRQLSHAAALTGPAPVSICNAGAETCSCYAFDDPLIYQPSLTESSREPPAERMVPSNKPFPRVLRG